MRREAGYLLTAVGVLTILGLAFSRNAIVALIASVVTAIGILLLKHS